MNKGGLWFPESATDLAAQWGGLYYFILWGSILLFAAIVATVIYFLFKYRRTPTNPAAHKQVIHNFYLEVIWTTIPTILVMFIFYWGYTDYLKMSIPPENALDIRVTGRQWAWQFEYPQGLKTLNEMVVPVNVPIRLVMTSTDVLHSFYIPNFRVKRDLVPNRYTRMWFEPNRLGQFQVFCAEYCGDSHSNMLATVKVVSYDDYEKWLKTGSSEADKGIPPAVLGEKLFASKGCNACHSIDGTTKIGPSWKGLYGAKREFVDGKSAMADDNYIRESMLDPKAKLVKGFQPLMTTFSGLLSDTEINAIIDYIKTLK